MLPGNLTASQKLAWPMQWLVGNHGVPDGFCKLLAFLQAARLSLLPRLGTSASCLWQLLKEFETRRVASFATCSSASRWTLLPSVAPKAWAPHEVIHSLRLPLCEV